MLVLKIVSCAPTYGYDVRMQIKQRSSGFVSVEDGTLYPILYRLESDELITSAWQINSGGEQSDQAQGKPRKIYTITEKGQAALNEEYRCWNKFSSAITCFFKEEPPWMP